MLGEKRLDSGDTLKKFIGCILKEYFLKQFFGQFYKNSQFWNSGTGY